MNRKNLLIFKLLGNFTFVNVKFIRRLSGVLSGFLNFLKSLFEMLIDPLLLSFFSVLKYVMISSSEVKSNLNDFSRGFVRNSCFLCTYNTLFNLFWDITEKVVKHICYLLFFYYQLFIIVDVSNLFLAFLLMLIISLIPTQTSFI